MKLQNILIIGGTGALGKTLINRYIDDNIITVFSRDEHKQVDLKKKWKGCNFIVGDIRNKTSIKSAINKVNPSVIINAAALKHIHICEENPFESVQTNIIGNVNLINAVEETKPNAVKGIVFTSTDKACKALNVYGMCKSISERIYQNFAKDVHANDIKITLVRYGNVLESTGSVIPYFKKLLGSDLPEKDRPTDYKLPITHPEMTRFFLTLDDAVNLLIDWAYHNPYTHGSIAIPKTKSLRIIDLAKILIKHYDPEVINTKTEKQDKLIESKIEIVGIRPGEKLHEVLVSEEESLRTEEHDQYYLITNDLVRNKSFIYNSQRDLITDYDEQVEFLKKAGVL